MSLRLRAEADARAIIADTSGFGWAITVQPPAGAGSPLDTTCLSGDIGEAIDPETGSLVSGRKASVVLSTGALADAGLAMPIGVVDTDEEPWRVKLKDTEDTMYYFRIVQTRPDRTIGVIVCMLEVWDGTF